MLLGRGRTAIVPLFLLLSWTCLFPGGVAADERLGIEGWVRQYIQKDEDLWCKKEVAGEYFFLAGAGNKVKLGAKLDMTKYSHQAHSFILGWIFQGEKGQSLVANTPPIAITQARYSRENGRTYVEDVQYQTLRSSDSRTVRVSIKVKKCHGTACDRSQVNSKEEVQYTIDLCETSLKAR